MQESAFCKPIYVRNHYLSFPPSRAQLRFTFTNPSSNRVSTICLCLSSGHPPLCPLLCVSLVSGSECKRHRICPCPPPHRPQRWGHRGASSICADRWCRRHADLWGPATELFSIFHSSVYDPVEAILYSQLPAFTLFLMASASCSFQRTALENCLVHTCSQQASKCLGVGGPSSPQQPRAHDSLVQPSESSTPLA